MVGGIMRSPHSYGKIEVSSFTYQAMERYMHSTPLPTITQPATGVCQQCGGKFPIVSKRGGPRYCPACKKERARNWRTAQNKRTHTRLIDITCAACGKVFHPVTSTTTCCSRACQQAMSVRKQVERTANLNVYTCQQCGKTYKAKKKNRDTFCSRECLYAHMEANALDPRPSGFNARGRYMVERFYGTDWRNHYERVSRLVVLQRDGWRCKLCGCKVKKASSLCADLATVDHIVPLKYGGDHKYSNLQAACWKCNVDKGTKLCK